MSDDRGGVRITLAGMSPDVLNGAESGDVVEPVQIINQTMLALSDDRRVRCGLRRTEPCSGVLHGK